MKSWLGRVFFCRGNSNISKFISEPDSLLLEDQRSEKSSKRHDQSGLLLICVVDGIHFRLETKKTESSLFFFSFDANAFKTSWKSIY